MVHVLCTINDATFKSNFPMNQDDQTGLTEHFSSIGQHTIQLRWTKWVFGGEVVPPRDKAKDKGQRTSTVLLVVDIASGSQKIDRLLIIPLTLNSRVDPFELTAHALQHV